MPACLFLTILLCAAPAVADLYGGASYGGPVPTVIWPSLPDAYVRLPQVSNGCGGGEAGTEYQIGDDSEYVDTEVPFRDEVSAHVPRYYVSFRRACDMHDAGYSGARTNDALAGFAVVDFFHATKAEIDRRFLLDMQRACDEQIPAHARTARANCKSYGGYHAASGAMTRFQVVDGGGWVFWNDRPSLSGVWTIAGSRGRTFSIAQKSRSITATWGSPNPDLRGEFRGTLISHDHWSIIEGFYLITDRGIPRGQPQPMSMGWSPRSRNEISLGRWGTLTR